MAQSVRFTEFNGGRVAVSTDVEAALARARGQARAEGFEEGAAQAEARFDRELAGLLTAVKASTDAATALRAEVEAECATGAKRVILAFVDALAPLLASETLVQEVADAAAAALASAPKARLLIHAPRDRSADLAEAIARITPNADVVASDDLDSSCARVHWRGGFDEIDAANLVAEARARLADRLTPCAAAITADDGAQAAEPLEETET